MIVRIERNVVDGDGRIEIPPEFMRRLGWLDDEEVTIAIEGRTDIGPAQVVVRNTRGTEPHLVIRKAE